MGANLALAEASFHQNPPRIPFGETKLIGNDALKWAGSRARMDLFVTDGE